MSFRSVFLAALALQIAGCDPVVDVPFNPSAPFKVAEDNKGAWVWIPVEESLCRDGSTTGFGFRYREGATAAVIYLQGGGACYDANERWDVEHIRLPVSDVP